jgi:hypothetical protein
MALQNIQKAVRVQSNLDTLNTYLSDGWEVVSVTPVNNFEFMHGEWLVIIRKI